MATENTPATPQQLDRIEEVTRAADAISLSLLFSLERQYLGVATADARFLRPVVASEDDSREPVHFLRLEQVGQPPVGSLHQPFTALQTALSACQQPGRFTLLFLVVSEGSDNRVYLGVRGASAADRAYEFVDYLGHFLEGNWPGTRLRRCHYQQEIQPRVLIPLSRDFKHAVALTGIPALKPGDNPGYPQSLDRLLRGMRDKRFMYLVVAEPLESIRVEEMVFRCRDLIGRVHALCETTLTKTLTQSEATTETEGRTKGWNAGFGLGAGGLATALGLLAPIFPPAGLAAGLIGAFGALNLGYSSSKQKGTAKQVGSSTSQAIAQKHINAHAMAAEEHLKRYVERFQQARVLGCWNTGVYLIAEDADTALQGGAQLRALLSGQKSLFEPIRSHDLRPHWAGGVQAALSELRQPAMALFSPDKGEPLEHPLGNAFQGLSTPLNTEELALLINLPQREVPGVRVMPTADFSLNPPPVEPEDSGPNKHFVLGHLLAGGEPTPLAYPVTMRSLAKHALITGITGSGKSTTCFRLLGELHKRGVPFLVIEPAKDEYAAWAMELNARLPPDRQISVYMPGVKSFRGQPLAQQLRLNPLDIVWLTPEQWPQVLAHIDRLKSIVNASFPMQEVLPLLLEDILFYTYNLPLNWLGDPLPPFDTPRPTLTQLRDNVATVVKSKGYDKEITGNLSAALGTRLDSLRRGWKASLFDQAVSTPWPTLFDRPAVVNLAQLGDDADRAFTMAILLQFLYEYRQASFELERARGGATDEPLRHVAVIEEAHRILLKAGVGGMEQASPQGKVAEMFANILSEIRAYGQGIVIVDQVPSRLVPDAVKNTNLKIVHRLVADDDRDAMGRCMTMTGEQTAVINRLRPGQAVVYGDRDDRAAWVKIPEQKPEEVLQ